MLTQIYNQKGEVRKRIKLPKALKIADKVNDKLIYQVANVYRLNQRRTIAHTIDRGEVRGGGKKPWPQKGTGRARHGSIRSPIWAGGGIAFGPRKEEVYRGSLPAKVRRLAKKMVLVRKMKDGEVFVLDSFQTDLQKTKDFVGFLEKFFKNIKDVSFFPGKTSLLFLDKNYRRNLYLASRNIPKVDYKTYQDSNALDLLNHKYVLIKEEVFKNID